MRKHCSVFMLMCRRTAPRALLLMLLVSAAQTAAFLAAGAGYVPVGPYSPEAVFTRARFALIAGAGLVLLCALFALTGCDFSGRQRYTTARLGVTEKAVFLHQALSHAVLLFIYLGLQLLTALALLRLSLEHIPVYGRAQAAMLAFYRSEYLHSLLPLRDWTRCLRVGVLLLSLCAALACFPVRQRRGEKPVAAFLLLGVVLFFFRGEMCSVSTDITVAMAAAIVSGVAVYALWEGGGYETT